MRLKRENDLLARVLDTIKATEARLEKSLLDVTVAVAGEKEAWWAYQTARRALQLAQEEREAAWEALRAVHRQLRRWQRR